jgi:hypothetical protein
MSSCSIGCSVAKRGSRAAWAPLPAKAAGRGGSGDSRYGASQSGVENIGSMNPGKEALCTGSGDGNRSDVEQQHGG